MKKTFFIWLALMMAMALQAQMMNAVHFKSELKTGNGAEAEIVFTAKIDQGWHVYSTDIGDGGPVEATFNVVKMDGVELVGKLTPKGNVIKRMDKMFNMEVKFFEGEATFVQKIRFTKPDYDIDCYLEYGACSDKMCLPPSEVVLKQSGKSPVAPSVKKEEEKPAAETTAEVAVPVPAVAVAAADSAVAVTADSAVVAASAEVAADLWEPVVSDLAYHSHDCQLLPETFQG